ncbi:glycosyltransferase family 9 protein [Rhodovibrio salinarum]|uniref:glycosyltransferase family 9 protein n=1 Tax=Rhodovibrio salinarum TaxID=1087 RepID=UPI001471A874|nr:glycosyltransferase family 9 protein [Rhodovibrio salinarum]
MEELIVIRKQRYNRHWAALWRRLVLRRWTAVVDLRRSALPWLLWAKHRATPSKAEANEHRVLTLARTLDAQPPPAPTVWTSPQDQTEADRLIGSARPVLAVGPTANWPGKVWPPERFAELVQRLIAPGGALAGASVFVTGGPNEIDQAQPVIDAVPSEQLRAGVGLSLPTTAAALQRCRLFIGNDSGLMHLAAAAGTPVLGLFGPTKDVVYGPWSRHSRVVRTPESYQELVGQPGFQYKTAGTQMTNLTVDTVEHAAHALLDETASTVETGAATHQE